jgi:uncharacterized protein (TIGR00251 family)
MTGSSFMKVHPDGVLLHLKIQPRASKTEIAGVLGAELKIKVTAPPVDSAANEAVLEFLAAVLACPRRCCVLLRGASSRHKQVLVHGMSLQTVSDRLKPQWPTE